jgi:hypothetical protein
LFQYVNVCIPFMIDPSKPFVACTKSTTLIHPYSLRRCGYWYHFLFRSLCTSIVVSPWLVPATIVFCCLGEAMTRKMSTVLWTGATKTFAHEIHRLYIESHVNRFASREQVTCEFSLSEAAEICIDPPNPKGNTACTPRSTTPHIGVVWGVVARRRAYRV